MLFDYCNAVYVSQIYGYSMWIFWKSEKWKKKSCFVRWNKNNEYFELIEAKKISCTI